MKLQLPIKIPEFALIFEGDTYRKTEQYDLSLAYYQKFLDLEPAHPRVRGIIEQIKKLDH
jgi:hypothetical protein